MKCFWIFGHDYTKWSELIKPYGANIHQWRKCKKCNRLVYRGLGYANGIYPDSVNSCFSFFNIGDVKQDNKK